MSDISPSTVQHVAKLSRIALDASELPRYASHLSSILDYIDQLNAVHTDGVLPLLQVSDRKNIFRDDIVTNTDRRAELLANAPAQENGFIKVKTVK